MSFAVSCVNLFIIAIGYFNWNSSSSGAVEQPKVKKNIRDSNEREYTLCLKGMVLIFPIKILFLGFVRKYAN